MLYRAGEYTLYAVANGKFQRVMLFSNGEEVIYDKFDADDPNNNDVYEKCVKLGIADVYGAFLVQAIESAGEILSKVTRVINYGISSGMDIFFGDKVFRLEKSGYISSEAFIIWYLAELHKIPRIGKDWLQFVRSLIDMAEASNHDPLAPDLIDILLSYMASGEIHTQFCDSVADYVRAHTDGIWFVYRKEEKWSLYVPSNIMASIRKQANVGSKAARQLWLPYLQDDDYHSIDARMYVGTGPYRKRLLKRFWVLSAQKLVEREIEIGNALRNKIDCNKEIVIGEENADKY